MNKYKIAVSPQFEKSLSSILDKLIHNQAVRLAKAVDNLNQILSILPECYPLVQFDRYYEIPYRKAVVGKYYIVVYFFQQEIVYLVNIFHSAENWKSKVF